tara:strand:+ start:122 stop:625 length:504 start_codon:yes stop_codon:yes gene_type:complete
MEEILKEKECFKCGVLKPLTQFYKHVKMADGRLNKCKSCTRIDVANNLEIKKKDSTWVSKELERCRVKQLLVDPIKARARAASKSIKSGKGQEKHHWSYNQDDWLDVIVMERDEHRKLHCYMTYDKDSLKFRTINNVLLHSRVLVELYISLLREVRDGYPEDLKSLF